MVNGRMVQSKNWSKQGFLLSPTITFLEGIWSDALKEYGGTVSIGGKIINNLWFANDTDALAVEEQEIVGWLVVLGLTAL